MDMNNVEKYLNDIDKNCIENYNNFFYKNKRKNFNRNSDKNFHKFCSNGFCTNAYFHNSKDTISHLNHNTSANSIHFGFVYANLIYIIFFSIVITLPININKFSYICYITRIRYCLTRIGSCLYCSNTDKWYKNIFLRYENYLVTLVTANVKARMGYGLSFNIIYLNVFPHETSNLILHCFDIQSFINLGFIGLSPHLFLIYI